MESKVFEKLLEKYISAETSVQEEKKLKAYFTSGDVAPHLQEYVSMFTYFSNAKEEAFLGKVDYEQGRKKVYSWVAIAASIVILFSVVLQQNDPVNEFGTYEDPEIALQKTTEALKMVGMMMNSGTDDLAYLQEFNETKNKIVKTP